MSLRVPCSVHWIPSYPSPPLTPCVLTWTGWTSPKGSRSDENGYLYDRVLIVHTKKFPSVFRPQSTLQRVKFTTWTKFKNCLCNFPFRYCPKLVRYCRPNVEDRGKTPSSIGTLGTELESSLWSSLKGSVTTEGRSSEGLFQYNFLFPSVLSPYQRYREIVPRNNRCNLVPEIPRWTSRVFRVPYCGGVEGRRV